MSAVRAVNRCLRCLFFLVAVRPLMLVVLGMNVRRKARLPVRGPAVVVANHNSHLDALALMTLFPMRQLRHVRPVAAADYFLRNRLLAWFATQIIGILPLEREVRSARADPLAGLDEALATGAILILFPEGTRGEPEQLERFKTGAAHLARRHPDVDLVPVFMHGLGRALPRGEALLVPFFCDVFVGEAFRWNGERGAFMATLSERMRQLSTEASVPGWRQGGSNE